MALYGTSDGSGHMELQRTPEIKEYEAAERSLKYRIIAIVMPFLLVGGFVAACVGYFFFQVRVEIDLLGLEIGPYQAGEDVKVGYLSGLSNPVLLLVLYKGLVYIIKHKPWATRVSRRGAPPSNDPGLPEFMRR